MSKQIKIIIADDHAMFIAGIQMILKEEQDMDVVDVAYNGNELLEVLKKHGDCLVLLDINMPEMSGLKAVKFIKINNPKTMIVMLSSYNEEHLIEKAKQLGANGYLLKTADKAILIQTIRQVASGQAVFPYRFVKQQTEFDGQDAFLRQYQITDREMDILKLIKQGLTNQQIAHALTRSIFTIETHRKNIMQKLKLNGMAALIKFINEHGI